MLVFCAVLALHLSIRPGRTQTPTDSELISQQAELFEALQTRPTDLELMFRYALVSVERGDYEPAIATLERMLVIKPDLPRVKLELGAAYFRLGSYAQARFYFDDVKASNPPPEVSSRIDLFLAQIDERSRRHRFSGLVSVGALYSDNATLGPQDRTIVSELFPGGTALIDPAGVAQDDIGIRVQGSLTHTYDLGLSSTDSWITSGSYAGLRYGSVKTGSYDAFEVVTGPRLSLDAEQYGAKIRPYLQGAYVRSGNAPLYGALGTGAEVSETLSRDVAVSASAGVQYRDFYGGREDFDGIYPVGTAGVAWSPVDSVVVRGQVFLESDVTDAVYTSNIEPGLRLSVTYGFSPGLAAPFDDPWSLTGFAQLSRRYFDGPDPAVLADTTREDTDLRLGLRLIVPVASDWALAADATLFRRNSNIKNYDLDSLEFGLSVLKSF